jgi:membrane-bound serine protease (ClpP class)
MLKRYILFLSLLSIYSLTLSSICLAETKVKLLTIHEDIINPVTADYVERGLKEAEKANALLIIKLDTPGGLLKSTEKIVKLILSSPVPVITYIYPKGGRAASAGVFISYASHILAMSPSTHIGAAHPVIGGGKWSSLGEEAKKKIINDTLAWAKNISQQRKRPFSFIRDAIEKSISITEEEALKRKVCDLVAEDINTLLKKIDNKIVTTSAGEIKISTKKFSIEEINFTPREKFLNTLIEPNIAYLLLTLGFLGLIFEVTHPGFGFPGIAGIICLILSFYAFSILPVNYAGLTLIVVGLIFFVVEAFTPTFGMFTLGGVISFILGSLMLFHQGEFIRVSFKVIASLTITLSALSIFLLSKIIASLREKPKVGSEALLNKEALAHTDIMKEGKVILRGEIWDAVGEGIRKGDKVIIEKVEGLKLYVKKKDGKE